MKHLIIPVVLVVMGCSVRLSAQGAEIARDIKNYIEYKKSESITTTKKSEDITTTESRTPPTTRPKIGGQEIDEAHSTIFKAFQIHTEWKDIVLVADWTGSMYPYVGQVMAWHQVNIGKKIVSEMALFNDGDEALQPNNPKPIGNAGGIYWLNPNKMDEMLKVIEKATDGGTGGDAPENDVEALLAAQQRHPRTKELVLIADNSAVRDIALLPKLTKPVHVILCNSGWVLDYVKIAYHTGGTITLLEDQLDFSDKSKIDPANVVLGGMRYDLR